MLEPLFLSEYKTYDIVFCQNVDLFLSQRQAREAQLERTIQGLNAALVVSRSNSEIRGTTGSDLDGSSGDFLRQISHLEARISALELDLHTANSHLAMEKERVSQFSKTTILTIVELLSVL